jgi:hypothetical protein
MKLLIIKCSPSSCHFLSLRSKYSFHSCPGWLVHTSVGCEVLTAVVMNSSVFWDITTCSPLKVSHLQGGRKSKASNQHEASSLNGGDMFLRNVGWLSTDYTALVPEDNNFSVSTFISYVGRGGLEVFLSTLQWRCSYRSVPSSFRKWTPTDSSTRLDYRSKSFPYESELWGGGGGGSELQQLAVLFKNV